MKGRVFYEICFFMNEVFLIGRLIENVEFDFIINSKKYKSIARMKIETLDKQYINIITYDFLADFAYSKIKKLDYVFINGFLCEDYVIVKILKNLTKN